MQNRIPVLSADDQPLTPCRPHRARQLIAQGKARRRHMEGIPYIHLTRRTRAESRVLFDYELNIDPGTSTSGYAIALTYPGGHRIIAALYERHHDAHRISAQLAKRSVKRRNRRGRLHYRKPTGLLEHKPEGWLAPSLRHLLEQHQRMIDALCALYPVGKIRIETGAFDTHLMQNPDLHGVEYQRGTLHGTQLRAYIRHRDGYRCAYCNEPKERLELDHIVPESKGGPTRVGNLVLACRRCNQRKGSRTLEEFLAGDPKRRQRIIARADTVSYGAATHMNATLPSVLAHARSKGVPVEETDAATTSWNRRRLEVDKKHSYDAALLGSDFGTVGRLPEMAAALRNNAKASKQKMLSDKDGTPRGKQYRDYCRLSPRERSKTATPGHSGSRKRFGPQGIGAGDIVEIEHRTAGVLRGIASVKNRGMQVALRGTKPSLSASIAKTRLIRRRPAALVKYEAPSQTSRGKDSARSDDEGTA